MIGAELRALKNACVSPEGRRAAAGSAILLLCLALGSLAFGAMVLGDDVVAALRGDRSGDVLAAVAAVLLAPPVLLALSFARLPCRHALFGAAWLPLLLTAPVASFRLVAAAWLRIAAGTAAVVVALVAAPALGLAARAGVPMAAAAAVPVVGVLLGGAAVAAVMALIAALTRWCSGPRLRLALAVLHVAFATAVIVLLLAGVVRGRDLQGALAALDPDASSLGSVARFVAGLPSALATGEVSGAAFAAPLACVIAIAASLAFTAALHRRAYEAYLVRAPAGQMRATRRSWPVTPVRSLLWRSALESWRARGNVAAAALLAAFAVWRAAAADPAAPPDDPVPRLRETLCLLDEWQMLASVMVLILFLGVVGDEQKQIALLGTAPLSRGDLLASRLVLVGWPFAMTIALMALAGLLVTRVAWSAAVGFLAAAVPVGLVLVGSAVAVGSWPAFIRVHDDMPLASNVRSVVPVLVLSAIAGAALLAAREVHGAILRADPGGWPPAAVAAAALGAAWLIAGAWLWACCRVACRNLERLLGPQ